MEFILDLNECCEVIKSDINEIYKLRLNGMLPDWSDSNSYFLVINEVNELVKNSDNLLRETSISDHITGVSSRINPIVSKINTNIYNIRTLIVSETWSNDQSLLIFKSLDKVKSFVNDNPMGKLSNSNINNLISNKYNVRENIRVILEWSGVFSKLEDLHDNYNRSNNNLNTNNTDNYDIKVLLAIAGFIILVVLIISFIPFNNELKDIKYNMTK